MSYFTLNLFVRFTLLTESQLTIALSLQLPVFKCCKTHTDSAFFDCIAQTKLRVQFSLPQSMSHSIQETFVKTEFFWHQMNLTELLCLTAESGNDN